MRVLIWIGGGVFAALLLFLIALQIAIWRNGPAVLDQVDRLAGGSRGVERVASDQFGVHPAQKLMVYRSVQASERQPVVLFIHGGSWKNGDPDDYGFIGRSFASRGFIVVTAGYRLHPASRFPDMVDDAAAAIGWTHREIERHGGDPNRIVLMGHSAGAYNAVQAVLDRQWLAAEEVPEKAIIAVIGIAGPYDFYPFDSESTRDSFGEADAPRATQPINFARGDAPPLLLLTGGKDTTVKPRNSNALAAAIQGQGGAAEIEIFPAMNHTDPLVSLAHPWLGRRGVMRRIEQFMAQQLNKAGQASLAVQAEKR